MGEVAQMLTLTQDDTNDDNTGRTIDDCIRTLWLINQMSQK